MRTGVIASSVYPLAARTHGSGGVSVIILAAVVVVLLLARVVIVRRRSGEGPRPEIVTGVSA